MNIYPAKKDIKNKKIAEIFQILGIGEDSKEENNQEVKDNDEIKKKYYDKVDKDYNLNVKENSSVKKSSEYLEKESSKEDSNDSFEELLGNLSLEQKGDKKVEIKKEQENNKEESVSNNNEQISNKNFIPASNFTIKMIAKDGNCFYRTISYYYRNRQEEYREFREIISSYILNNPDEYIFAVTDQDMKADDNMDELIKIQKKREYIIEYAKKASVDGEWAGNIEIATVCTLFNCNINMYTINELGYTIYHKYNSEEENLRQEKDTIEILYINENHFNLLIPNNNKGNYRNNVIQQNINIKDLNNIILKDKEKSNRKLDLNLKIDSNSKKYVDYPRYGLKNYYNEINNYLIDNTVMPKRLEYSKEKNRKTVEKKRGKFRKLVNEKYRISDNRLQYSYYYKNKLIWLNIIYQKEKIPILNYIHFNCNHIKRETMEGKIIEAGFYWQGYSNDIIEFINNCGICHSELRAKKIENNPKIIISYGPNKRYQCDLWYLPDRIKENTHYIYCLDIKDHFRKWMGSYLLKNKTAELVLSKIKIFFRENGKCEIFQTDNGKEFNNVILKTYLENNNVKYLRSAPYHPQTNGCCEVVHKEIKSYLLRKKEEKEDNFDLEIEIEEAIEFHNFRTIKSTGFKPIEIRHVVDKNIIENVNNNIIKSMKRKLKNKNKITKNTLLLLCPEIEIKNNVYVFKKQKSKKQFIIPAIFIKYLNSNNISVKIMVNYLKDLNLKRGDNINISSECCRIIDDFGFCFYLKKYGENINFENLNKLALFED